jgi:hypothetical protein
MLLYHLTRLSQPRLGPFLTSQMVLQRRLPIFSLPLTDLLQTIVTRMTKTRKRKRTTRRKKKKKKERKRKTTMGPKEVVLMWLRI